MSKISSYFAKLASNFRYRRDIKRYESIMDEIETEQDLEKRFEKKVLLELNGTLLGGMASSTAYMSFKTNYFNKLSTNNEQEQVIKVLLNILRSAEYKSIDKVQAAYVVADIVILDAIPEIEKLLKVAKKGSIEADMYQDSLDALRKREPISVICRRNMP